MTQQQFDEVGDAVAVGVLIFDCVKAGRDVRLLASLGQLPLHRLQARTKRIVFAFFHQGIGWGVRRCWHVGSAASSELLWQQGSKVIDEGFLVWWSRLERSAQQQ